MAALIPVDGPQPQDTPPSPHALTPADRPQPQDAPPPPHALTPADRPQPQDTPPPPHALTPTDRPQPQDTPPPPLVLSTADEALLEALGRDGRAGYTDLAAATGWPESTVRRRMRELRRSGALYYDVEVRPLVFGFSAAVMLWVTVAPARLAAVGAALAGHEEVVFAAATTGATNLMATVICRDMAAFYRYLTERVSGLDGVDRVESTPLLRHVKQLGPAVPSM
ncbi:Lrp/AsnC family transcriptional regulator [Actinoplanes sp. NEAU-H7]|uniref:Lrp/AsnC family transcriptional regulator n=1 Tax=Actinoplanes flavus TaxID=2820290 RepID=A0ABS3UR19_9ACTN|nr:Lrp/AsnC family transcriptional regulator [Actinoplanes flavus]